MGNIRPRRVTELLPVLWKNKTIIFLITMAMLFATTVVVKGLPDLYESRGLVVISNAASDVSVAGAQIAAVSQQVTSQTQLELLLSKYPLYNDPDQQDRRFQLLRRALKIETKFRGYYPDGPESFTLSYRYSDPRLAQQVVADLVELFTQSNANTREQAYKELTSVNEELQQVEEQLHGIMNTAAQSRPTAKAMKPAIDPATVNAQRLTTTATIESLKDKQFSLEQQIATLKQQIVEQQKLAKQNASTNTAKSVEGPLLLRKAELQARLNEYVTQYTEKNPKVIQTRTELTEVNRQLAALRPSADPDTTTVTSLEAQELRTHQRELARLETELEVARRELERHKEFLKTLPAIDPASAYSRTEAAAEPPSTREAETMAYGSRSERQRTLLARREGLQKLLSGADLFQLVDRPGIAQAPVGPNRMLLDLLGLGVGLCSGVLLALGLEIPRLRRMQDERDVEYFLGAPVLALIPETLTPAENNRAQRLHLARRGVVVLLVVGLIPVFYLLLKTSGVLQLLGSR